MWAWNKDKFGVQILLQTRICGSGQEAVLWAMFTEHVNGCFVFPRETYWKRLSSFFLGCGVCKLASTTGVKWEAFSVWAETLEVLSFVLVFRQCLLKAVRDTFVEIRIDQVGDDHKLKEDGRVSDLIRDSGCFWAELFIGVMLVIT